jgi:ATP-dependent DNA helicase RecG
MLDKVQKNKRLSLKEEKYLKIHNLIEGRKPHFYVAKKVAQHTGQKVEYSKNKAFEKEKYVDWILKTIKEFGGMNRKEVDSLLWNMLPAWMDNKQRKIKFNNLLSELRKKGFIMNQGTLKNPKWVLIESVL